MNEALSLASRLPRPWAEVDGEGKRGMLETAFARLVVDRQRFVDTEVWASFSWLLRLKPEGKALHVQRSASVRLSKLT